MGVMAPGPTEQKRQRLWQGALALCRAVVVARGRPPGLQDDEERGERSTRPRAGGSGPSATAQQGGHLLPRRAQPEAVDPAGFGFGLGFSLGLRRGGSLLP